MALAHKWIAGVKNILWSNASHATFQALPFDQQTEFVHNLIAKVTPETELAIIMETLTRRPSSKHLVLAIIEKGEEMP